MSTGENSPKARYRKVVVEILFSLFVAAVGIGASYYFCQQGMWGGKVLGERIAQKYTDHALTIGRVGGVWGLIVGGSAGALLSILLVHLLFEVRRHWMGIPAAISCASWAPSANPSRQ